MPDSHLSQGTSLRRKHLLSFQRCFNEYLLQDIQKHKITDCFAERSCKCAEQSDVSQQRHNEAQTSH